MRARIVSIYHLNKDISGSSIILDRIIDVLTRNHFLVKENYANQQRFLNYSLLDKPFVRNIKFLAWQLVTGARVFFCFDKAEIIERCFSKANLVNSLVSHSS